MDRKSNNKRTYFATQAGPTPAYRCGREKLCEQHSRDNWYCQRKRYHPCREEREGGSKRGQNEQNTDLATPKAPFSAGTHSALRAARLSMVPR